MGAIGFSISTSSYDKCRTCNNNNSSTVIDDDKCRICNNNSSTVIEKVIIEKPLPNPNPKNYKIRNYIQDGKYLLLLVNYPDCKNYEGNKILLYKNTYKEDLFKQGSIDPHFSDNKRKHSPIARFEPTLEGWESALKYIKVLSKKL